MKYWKQALLASVLTVTLAAQAVAQAGGGAAGGGPAGTGASSGTASGAPAGSGVSTTGGPAIGTTGRATDPASRTEIRKEKEVEEGATPSTVPK